MTLNDVGLIGFRYGSRTTTLVDIIGNQTLSRLEKKFSAFDVKTIGTGLIELCRFLYLVGYANKPVFFPGDELIDELWHALIIETADYRRICSNIKTNAYFEHTGIKFKDYLDLYGASSVREEQLSWLASYHSSFGDMTSPAFERLNLARSLASELNTNLDGLNKFATTLAELRNVECEKDRSDFQTYCAEVIPNVANELFDNPEVLSFHLRRILVLANATSKECALPFSNSDLQNLFGSSITLAFVVWQHLAALERLHDTNGWRAKNQNHWEDLRSGSLLCGLATTHIANRLGSPLIATVTDEAFSLNGYAPWVTGYGIFDELVIGFETKEEIVFVLCEFPKRADPGITIELIELNSMMGTSTARITFSNYRVPADKVISRRAKSARPGPRPSRYRIPELGAVRAMVRILRSNHLEKSSIMPSVVTQLESRFNALELAREDINSDVDLEFEMAKIVRDTVRILTICEGGRSLLKGCYVSRIQAEAVLFDCVIQSPSTLNRKLEESAKG